MRGKFFEGRLSVCCGVDVHKTLMCFHNFADWLQANQCLDVCMESTGNYGIPVFNVLEQCGLRVTVPNPKWLKR